MGRLNTLPEEPSELTLWPSVVGALVSIGLLVLLADLNFGSALDHWLGVGRYAAIGTHPLLAVALNDEYFLFGSPMAFASIATVILLLGLKRTWLRLPGEALGMLSVILFSSGYAYPHLFFRSGPYTSSNSFPDMLVLASAAGYGLLYMMARYFAWPLGTRLIVVTTGIWITVSAGFMRVYLGYAWPSDVIGGFLGGVALAFLAFSIVRLLAEKGFR